MVLFIGLYMLIIFYYNYFVVLGDYLDFGLLCDLLIDIVFFVFVLEVWCDYELVFVMWLFLLVLVCFVCSVSLFLMVLVLLVVVIILLCECFYFGVVGIVVVVFGYGVCIMLI